MERAGVGESMSEVVAVAEEMEASRSSTSYLSTTTNVG